MAQQFPDDLKKRLDELAELRGQDIITSDEWQRQRTAMIAEYLGTATPASPPSATAQASPAVPPAPAPTYQPAVAQNRSGILKWGMWGCVGALAFVGALVVGGCVLFFAAVSTTDTVDLAPILTGDADDITVTVSGDEAVAFAGSLGSGASQRTVEGTIPSTFTLTGEDSSGIFVAVLQKQQEAGAMTVTLSCRRGDKSGETTAAFGVVTVSC